MDVSLKNNDAVSGIVELEIVKADYADQVDKSLHSLRQKANVPDFRKGMIPASMVKRMYGRHILVEEINKLVSENLFEYIRKNDLHILGEPMPNETKQKPLNFDKEEDPELRFNVVLAPEISIELSKNGKLPFYQVAIDEEVLNNQASAYRSNLGSYDKVDEIEEKGMVKGTVVELENDAPKEGGIVVEDIVLMPMYIEDKEEKAKFIGAKVNAVVVFNLNKTYGSAKTEIASLLKIDREKVAETTGGFSFEIKETTRHKDAQMNQELFDKVFGKNVATSEEEFRNKIKEALAGQLAPQSDFKFLTDTRDMLVEKAGELNFANDLLKRWLFAANEESTEEKIDEDFPQILQDLRYQLIKENLIRKNGPKVGDADIENFTKRVAKTQFAQYGILSVPEDVLGNYTKDMSKNKQTLQNVIDRVVEEKLATWLKEQMELDVRKVTADELNKLFEQKDLYSASLEVVLYQKRDFSLKIS